MRCDSPAKINLYLKVGPRRPDGYHDLVSWFVTCGLCDRLEFINRDDGELRLVSPSPTLPVDDTNLVLRAARALQRVADVRKGGAIQLDKHIPMGAGLGGGSSNAATTLVALNDLWQLGLSTQQLATLGAELGSDVPFFLQAPSAICRGRGERVQPVTPPAGKWVLLVLPDIHMPTPRVYRRFDELQLGSDLSQSPDTASLCALPSLQLMTVLFNDLETPAFSLCPQLGELRRRVEMITGRTVRMSGSGSSLFTLFDSQTQAQQAATRVMGEMGIRATGVPLAVCERPDDVR